ncbi:hypothetical protein Y1Q_0016276 [Alligator mississippiensis]|uniref:SCAN box domain-containing protein n=1 Tax=Alligator mississippiensis TaxID=8496 RepID=A0A151M428_ALLMI|nr:hypothetical protein Y1Q_0016276 [Alligator mississippiensis]
MTNGSITVVRRQDVGEVEPHERGAEGATKNKQQGKQDQNIVLLIKMKPIKDVAGKAPGAPLQGLSSTHPSIPRKSWQGLSRSYTHDERHAGLQLGALAGNGIEEETLEANAAMEVNLNAQMDLLGQTLHAVTKVLEVQQQQAIQQQDWMCRNWTTFCMHWMTLEDDVEAYIEAFERTPIQMGLDRLQWTTQLRALVVGKAQAAYRALPREDAYDYDKVKTAILCHLELTPEHYQKLFCAKKSKEDRKPHHLMQLLKDLLDKWVPPGKIDWATLADQILLEQFIKDLEEDTQLWVRHHLLQTAMEALQIVEAFVASEGEVLMEKRTEAPR